MRKKTSSSPGKRRDEGLPRLIEGCRLSVVEVVEEISQVVLISQVLVEVLKC